MSSTPDAVRGTLHIVCDRKRRYRVIRLPLTGHVFDQDHWGGFMAGFDKVSLRKLAAIWRFAARSPHTLIYLQLPHDAAIARGMHNLFGRDGLGLEVVLSHHSQQFRPAEWKGVRARLGNGHAVTLSPPPFRPSQRTPQHWVGRDRPKLTVASKTLLVAGSRRSFEKDLPALIDVAKQGPAERARDPSCRPSVSLLERRLHVELIDP